MYKKSILIGALMAITSMSLAGMLPNEEMARQIMSHGAASTDSPLNQNINISPDEALSRGNQMLSDPNSINNQLNFGKGNLAASNNNITPDSDEATFSRKYCVDGNCGDEAYTPSPDFGDSTAKLLGLLSAGGSLTQTERQNRIGCRPSRHSPCPTTTVTQILSGNHYRCHEAGFGYNNCCSQKGWGQDLGLAGCNNEEAQLGGNRDKRLCVYVGSFCESSTMGRCTKHKQSWCCYSSPLARLIQEQAHVQLNWSYGDPKHPACHGLGLDALQSLDFNRMDFTEIAQDLAKNATQINGGSIESLIHQQMLNSGNK